MEEWVGAADRPGRQCAASTSRGTAPIAPGGGLPSSKSSGLYTTVMYSEQDGQRAISSPARSSSCGF